MGWLLCLAGLLLVLGGVFVSSFALAIAGMFVLSIGGAMVNGDLGRRK